MVKSHRQFELSQRFALQDLNIFKRRFVLKPHTCKESKVGYLLQQRKPSSAAHLTQIISVLRNEWTAEFDGFTTATEPSLDHDGEDSTVSYVKLEKSIESPLDAAVPQEYWDDLFDKALGALNTINLDEDVQMTPCNRMMALI